MGLGLGAARHVVGGLLGEVERGANFSKKARRAGL